MTPDRFQVNLLRRCHECQHPLGKKDLFCPRCGAKQGRSLKVTKTGDEMKVTRYR